MTKRFDAKKFFIVVIILILFIMGIIYLQDVTDLLQLLIRVFRPFLIGIGMAFLLNIPTQFFENLLAKWLGKSVIWMRMIGIFISLLLSVFGVYLLMFLVIPDLRDTLTQFISVLPDRIYRFASWINQTLADHPKFVQAIMSINISPEQIQSYVTGLLNNAFNVATVTLQSLFDVTVNLFGLIFDVVVAFVFALALLLTKESVIRQFKKFVYALFPLRWANFLVSLGHTTNNTFKNFASGEFFEAIILGLLTYFGMLIFGFPYAVTVSVVTGASAFIPFYGAFLGGGLGAILIGVQNFWGGFWFLVLIVVIQQIEGNLIYPYVVGKGVGLPTTWTLVTITVFGALFGVLGMILSVPITSIVYQLLSENVNFTLEQKGVEDIQHDTTWVKVKDTNFKTSLK
ncbi:MAG: AI-2E family transporter [Aerococcus sp.]|nr:AI-2E family transporter [Aerococcus sp.]